MGAIGFKFCSPHRSEFQGVSLVEAIVSIFLLAAVLIMAAGSTQTALRYSSWASERAVMATLAEKHLNQLRQTLHTPAGSGYKFDNWASYDNTQVTDPDDPRFQIKTRIEKMAIYSPCTELEREYITAGTARVMRDSNLRVRIQVTGGRQDFTLWSAVGDPYRGWASANNITTNPSALGSVAPSATAAITVVGLDANNQPIKDLFFYWGVGPINSTGSISSTARDGSSCSYINQVRIFYPPSINLVQPAKPGDCRVDAGAVYGGIPSTGNTTVTNQ